MSPISKVFRCCVKGNDKESLADEKPIDTGSIKEVALPEPTPVIPSEVTPLVPAPKKGHRRTPSEASAPVVASKLSAVPPVARSDSNTSSHVSSASVITAIEISPIAENEDKTVVTAIEKRSKIEDQKSDDGGEKKTTRRISLPKKRMPDDVTTLDKVEKLRDTYASDKHDLSHPFWDKISIFNGDITKIEIDAIVNAANSGLAGGGGVDGAIHRAAGYGELQKECQKHDRPVATGDAVVTGACKLSTHVKNIIHCVGPICYSGVTAEKRKKLISCYTRAIQLAEEKELRSIAFCCISTGIYGYSNKDAAESVLKTLWRHLDKKENAEKWDRIVLCLFMEIDKKWYDRFIREVREDPEFFADDGESEEDESEEEKEEEKEEKKKERKEEKKKDEEKEEKKKERKEEKKKDEEKEEKDEVDAPEKEEEKREETKEGESTVEKEHTVEEKKSESTVDGKEEESTVGEGERSRTGEPSSKSASASNENGGEKKEEENRDANGELARNGDKVEGGKKRGGEGEGDGPPMKKDRKGKESSV